MRRMTRIATLFAFAVAMIAGSLGSASAAHNGNNQATFTGDVTGRAIVNYAEGRGTFSGSISVSGLEPNMSYTFQVRGTTATPVCSGESNDRGAFSCSFQGMPLPGFGSAEIADEDGTVASSTFERGGNCRDPEQAGTQCERNKHRH